MANQSLQHQWTKWVRVALTNTRKVSNAIARSHPASLEYRQWCDRLLRRRFRLSIGLAIAYLSIEGLADFYEVFINSEQLLWNLALLGLTHLLGVIRQGFILHKVIALGLLGCLVLAWRSVWLRKHPALILVLMPWAIAFVPEIILGAFLRIPGYPSIIMFMAQVAIAPVHWRLHLISQIVPIGFYFIVYPLIGLATFNGRSIYSFSYTVELILVCIICEVGVYLYEQSKQAELEANQRLQLFIHSITHDLRTPVMGSLMLLQSIRQNTPINQPVQLSQTEIAQLIQGSTRLLGLMNALLDTQALSQKDLVLQCQPAQLNDIVPLILQDLQSSLIKQNIQVDNCIAADLPLVEVDAQQIGRVFNNLIANAIEHNPPGIRLTLDTAIVKTPQRMLKVMIQDNGIGIDPVQQATIFEPYTRGKHTEYLSGLGLGLYICQQVIRSHGGEIGVESEGEGTRFWFTLPIKG